MHCHGFVGGVTAQRWAAGEAFVHDASERINVGANIQRLGHALLGAHIERTAENFSGLGQVKLAAGMAYQLGDAEIDYFEHLFAVFVFDQAYWYLFR